MKMYDTTPAIRGTVEHDEWRFALRLAHLARLRFCNACGARCKNPLCRRCVERAKRRAA